LSILEFYPLSPYEIYSLWRRMNRLRSEETQTWQIFERRVAIFLKEVGCHLELFSTKLKGISGRHQFEITVRPPAASLDDFILIECKLRRIGSVLLKHEIMIFNEKAIDVYHRKRIGSVPFDNIYRLLVSSVPLDHTAFRFCLANGIKVLMPYYGRRDYPGRNAIVIPVEVAYCKLADHLIRKGGELSRIDDLMRRLYLFSKREWYPIGHRPIPRSSGYQMEKEHSSLIRQVYDIIGSRW